MIVAVRPPEYFPRAEVLALLLTADCFVIGDTLAYSRQSFQNRCRIRTPIGEGPGWMWLTVPLVRGAVGRRVCEVRIAPGDRWRGVHRKSLLHHLGSAPYWPHFEPEFNDLLAVPVISLSDLTAATVTWGAGALHVADRLRLASELPGSPSTVPAILSATRATTFLTLPESEHRDAELARAAGVALKTLHFEERERRQNFPGFVADCGATDLFANHGPDVRRLLRSGIEP